MDDRFAVSFVLRDARSIDQADDNENTAQSNYVYGVGLIIQHRCDFDHLDNVGFMEAFHLWKQYVIDTLTLKTNC